MVLVVTTMVVIFVAGLDLRYLRHRSGELAPSRRGGFIAVKPYRLAASIDFVDPEYQAAGEARSRKDIF